MDNSLLLSRTNYFLTASDIDEQFVRSYIDELRTLIIEHNTHYYITANPLISDGEYDQLFALLVSRENRFPELITAQSPTQRLVGQKIDWFSSAAHLAEMSSLQNTYSAEDIIKRDEWLKRIQQKQDIADRSYIGEPKLDGMSVEIVYEFWSFVRAVTRGDGEQGEDITEHAKLLIWLPFFIEWLKTNPVIAFRGEIVMPKEAFSSLATTLTTSWTTFANPRNATAGTLRQLDTSLVKKRWLTVRVYDILYSEWTLSCINAQEQFHLFRERWLPIVDWMSTFSSIQEVVAWCTSPQTQQRAQDEEIELDGLVIKIVDFSTREQFWSTNHHPKRAIAYKFPAQQIVTQLEEVHFQVGRTGILTPVAQLTPVKLSGVTISRASLHNRAFIQERWLRVGDRVMIQRSGEVIPYIVSTLSDRRTGNEKEIIQPTHCPVCQHAVYLDDRALALWCGNISCDAQIKQRLEYAVSKNCLDISWLGPSLIEQLVNVGLLHTIADIFTLFTPEKKQMLRWLPGVADKKITQLEKEVFAHLPYQLRSVVNALGIRHIGEVGSRDLVEVYFSIKEASQRSVNSFVTYCLDEQTITWIHWFGKEMVASLQTFFLDTSNLAVLKQLEEAAVIDRNTGSQKKYSDLLAQIHIVITWSFDLSRDEIKKYLEAHGAIVQNTVTSTTDVLLVGEWWWSKREAAEKWWVSCLNSADFFQRFDLSPRKKQDSTVTEQQWVHIQQTSLFW